MNKVAVLLTCFNRKEKTESCLIALEEALKQSGKNKVSLSIYLTDDQSTDGTAEMVNEKFPYVNLLKGNGELYWAGGMRNSWKAASKKEYDAYLLLNDDTTVVCNLFDLIFQTQAFCKNKYLKDGVYVGRTEDPNSKQITYGGSKIKNWFLGTLKETPYSDKEPMECHMGNANVMWVSKQAFEKNGILASGFVHGMADYDYTLNAVKQNIPVLVIPGISGQCMNDHGDIYQKFIQLPLKKRIEFLYHPVGLDFNSQLYHMRRNFIVRWPIVYLTGWFKVLFPSTYYRLIYKPRM